MERDEVDGAAPEGEKVRTSTTGGVIPEAIGERLEMLDEKMEEFAERLERIEGTLRRIERLIDISEVTYACPRCGTPLPHPDAPCPYCQGTVAPPPPPLPPSRPGYDPSPQDSPATSTPAGTYEPDGIGSVLCPVCSSSMAFIPGKMAYYCPVCKGYLDEKSGTMLGENGQSMSGSADGMAEEQQGRGGMDPPAVHEKSRDEDWDDGDDPLQEYKAFIEFKGDGGDGEGREDGGGRKKKGSLLGFFRKGRK